MPSSNSPTTGRGQTARTETKARLSLFLGILAFLVAPLAAAITMLGIFPAPVAAQLSLPVLAGFLAVLLGHFARARIRRSAGQLKGKKVALAGLIFGYLSLAVISASMVASDLLFPRGFVKAPAAIAHESDAQSVIRKLNEAEAKYSATYPQQGFAPDLATLGPGSAGTCSGTPAHACLIDKVLGSADCTGTKWCDKGGYKYNLQPATLPRQKAGYCITATPAANSGAKSYCSLADGMIRYDLSHTPRTTPYTPRECGSLPPL